MTEQCVWYHTTYSYTQMCDCWNEDADERPTFSHLVSTISERLESLAGYLDFCPIWSSGEKDGCIYDHLVQVKLENKDSCDRFNPTVIISDED